MSPLAQDGLCASLVCVRLLAALAAAPVFGARQTPALLKVLLAMAGALVLVPLLPPGPRLPDTVCGIMLAVAWEASVGTALGLIASLGVQAAGAAGSAIDLQSGFASASLLNPGGDEPMPLMASFYRGLATLVLLAGDFHHSVLLALMRSFEWLPAGGPGGAGATLRNALVDATTGFLGLVAAIALPVLLGLLGVEVAVAFLSRALPQINMLLAAAPLRVMAACLMVAISLPLFLDSVDRALRWSRFYLGGSG